MKADEVISKGRNRFTLITSIIASIIAIISIIISKRSCNLSEKEYLLKLNPVLNIEFGKLGKPTYRCYFKIRNDGAISVYNVKVRILSRTFVKSTNKYAHSYHVNDDWKLADEIKVGDTMKFYISYDILRGVVSQKYVDKHFEYLDENEVVPVLYLLFEFYKEPDKSKFLIEKYLMVFEDKESEKFIIQDAGDVEYNMCRYEKRLEIFNEMSDSLGRIIYGSEKSDEEQGDEEE